MIVLYKYDKIPHWDYNKYSNKMLPLNTPLSAQKQKQGNSGRKELTRNMLDERGLGFLAQTMPASNNEMLTITVIPCGREDGKNSEEEMPYEIKIRKKRKIYSD